MTTPPARIAVVFSNPSTTLDVRRLGALLLAVLQLGAAGIQGVDAILESERTALPTHIESHEAEECQVEHDHLFCQVVRSLGAVANHADQPGLVGVEGVVVDGRPALRDHAISSAAAGSEALPRAPPLA